MNICNAMQYRKTFFLIAILCFLGINAQNADCKCCTPEYSEFDFWLGNWQVTNKTHKIVGKNTITKIQDNCALKEEWSSAQNGVTGTSYNFYNQRTKAWEQIWVDNQGTSLHLKGKRLGNQMILKSEKSSNLKGKESFNKITWTKNDDGTVRQLWEVVTEGEATIIAFDGIYTKID